jgi:hypothetical protein
MFKLNQVGKIRLNTRRLATAVGRLNMLRMDQVGVVLLKAD